MTKWEIRKLGDVCEFFNGQAHEKCIDENGKYKVINSKFISSEGLIYKKTNIALSPLVKNDIVLCMSDVPNGKTIAKCFLVDKNDTYTLNQRICVIRSTLFDAKFLYYQLNRNKYFLSFDNGENQTNLRKDDILNCGLLIPPLSEQQHIVAILDEVFDGIAKAKANAEQNLKNAQELFESYLQSVFENKGEGWEEKKLESCFKLKSGDGLTSKMMSDDGIYPVFGGNGIAGLHNNFNLIGSNVIIGRVGALCGNVRHIEESIWLTDNAFKVVDCQYEFDNAFLTYLLNYKNLRSFARQAAQPVISNSSLKDVLLHFPKSLFEQQTIVQKLDGLSLETKKLETIYRTKIADLEELKKSILHKAFNGEL